MAIIQRFRRLFHTPDSHSSVVIRLSGVFLSRNCNHFASPSDYESGDWRIPDFRTRRSLASANFEHRLQPKVRPMNAKSLRLNPLLIMSGLLLFAAVAAVAVAQPNAKPQAHELSDAVLQDDVGKVKQLIKAGADLQVLDDRSNRNGRYPLNWAAWQNNVDIINALLDAGADINKANLTGFTALHHAIENGSKEAAALLIKRGANLNAVNRNGMTPLQFAEAKGNQEVAAMIKEAAKK